MVQAALDESARRKYDDLAVSLFDSDGQYLSRRSSGASTRIDYAWAQLEFNWIKKRDFSAKRQCHPTNRICVLLTKSSMPFTHRVALPGAVVLRSAGHVTGVLAVP